jgi:hypothetical protein
LTHFFCIFGISTPVGGFYHVIAATLGHADVPLLRGWGLVCDGSQCSRTGLNSVAPPVLWIRLSARHTSLARLVYAGMSSPACRSLPCGWPGLPAITKGGVIQEGHDLSCPYGSDQEPQFTATFAERNCPATLESCGAFCVGCMR